MSKLVAEGVKKVEPQFEPSYSITEFCLAEGISPPSYYKLKKLDLAPREMRGPLHTVRISHQARKDWQRMMEQPSEDARKATEAMRERAQAAVKKAVASPRHPANRNRRRRVA